MVFIVQWLKQEGGSNMRENKSSIRAWAEWLFSMQRSVVSACFRLLGFACLQLAWCTCQPVIDEYHHLKCERKRLCEGRHDELPPAGSPQDTLHVFFPVLSHHSLSLSFSVSPSLSFSLSPSVSVRVRVGEESSEADSVEPSRASHFDSCQIVWNVKIHVARARRYI